MVGMITFSHHTFVSPVHRSPCTEKLRNWVGLEFHGNEVLGLDDTAYGLRKGKELAFELFRRITEIPIIILTKFHDI